MPLKLRENENRNDANISKLHIKVKNVNKKIRSLKENYKTIHRVIPRPYMCTHRWFSTTLFTRLEKAITLSIFELHVLAVSPRSESAHSILLIKKA
jgi:hypothetical protein